MLSAYNMHPINSLPMWAPEPEYLSSEIRSLTYTEKSYGESTPGQTSVLPPHPIIDNVMHKETKDGTIRLALIVIHIKNCNKTCVRNYIIRRVVVYSSTGSRPIIRAIQNNKSKQ